MHGAQLRTALFRFFLFRAPSGSSVPLRLPPALLDPPAACWVGSSVSDLDSVGDSTMMLLAVEFGAPAACAGCAADEVDADNAGTEEEEGGGWGPDVEEGGHGI